MAVFERWYNTADDDEEEETEEEAEEEEEDALPPLPVKEHTGATEYTVMPVLEMIDFRPAWFSARTEK